MKISTDPNCRILVIGDLMIDHYIYGGCNRISPEAPVPVVEVSADHYTLGGAGNVLKNLLALGCRADIFAVVGDDRDAGIAFKELEANGISTEGILQDTERCTTIKTRVMVSHHQLLRMDREMRLPISGDQEQLLLLKFASQVQDYDLVLLSDYNKGMLTASFITGIVSLCREHNIPTIADPKGNDYFKYKGVNIIKPNKKEAALATGIAIHDLQGLLEACLSICNQTACDSVIITMSEEGIALFSDGELTVIPTRAQAVTDVTGAGDTVLATLGFALAARKPLLAACELANHAAAVVVNKVGSATATLDEIYHSFENSTDG